MGPELLLVPELHLAHDAPVLVHRTRVMVEVGRGAEVFSARLAQVAGNVRGVLRASVVQEMVLVAEWLSAFRALKVALPFGRESGRLQRVGRVRALRGHLLRDGLRRKYAPNSVCLAPQDDVICVRCLMEDEAVLGGESLSAFVAREASLRVGRHLVDSVDMQSEFRWVQGFLRALGALEALCLSVLGRSSINYVTGRLRRQYGNVRGAIAQVC